MKFNELVEQLLESTSPLRTLYHNTLFYNMAGILRSNYFSCSLNGEDIKDRHMELFKKYPYYMSAARIPYNRFARKQTVFRSIVSMELDASKLSDHGYPIRPINFFARSNSQESEDRVLSRKNKIDNFKEYIKSFHIYVHPNDMESILAGNSNADMDKYDFNYTIKNILNTNKPAYVYNTRDAFHTMNRAKREPLSEKHLIT
jgi:hypothetical protein